MKIVNKKNTYLLLVFVIGLLFITINKTYAKFPSSYTTADNIVGLNLNFNIGISNIEEYQRLKLEVGESKKINVEISNSVGSNMAYGVWYKVVDGFNEDNVEVGKLKESSTSISGTISNGSKVTVEVVINNNSTDTIYVDIGVGSSSKTVNDIEYLNGKKLIVKEIVKNLNLLVNVLKRGALLDTDTTNDKGTFLRSGTENDTNPIYYYRGNVDNNNVIFADMCFKIVRTTETGGVKLLYNGVSFNGQCNATSKIFTTVDSSTFSEDLSPSYETSEIKKVIDNWYAKKILQTLYYKYVEDTVWCNDTSYDSIGYGETTYYGASKRLDVDYDETPQPSLECPKAEDKYTVSSTAGNGKLIYPVGLLTADEVYLATKSGSYMGVAASWWTMSPSEYYHYGQNDCAYRSSFYCVNSSGGLISQSTSGGNRFGISASGTDVGVRPAISLKAGITFKSGNGTKGDPYIIDYENPKVAFINEDFSDTTYDNGITITDGATYPWIVDTEKEIFRSNNVGIINSESISTISFKASKGGTLIFDYGISSYYDDKFTITLTGSDSTNKVLINGIGGSDPSDNFVGTTTGVIVEELVVGVTYTLELKYKKVDNEKPAFYDDIAWIDNLKVAVDGTEVVSVPKKKLSEVKVGSYVNYIGNNGCSGTLCDGQNANYVNDSDMGYCYNASYKYKVNGWRVAYIADGTAYLVSAGAPECLCTAEDGTNNAALKYCNSGVAYGGVCNSSSAWNMNDNDFNKIINNNLSSCYQTSKTICGSGNDLLDNGGLYWFATPYSTSGTTTFVWRPQNSRVNSDSTSSIRGVRPVLRLKSSVVVIGGSGTYKDPYSIRA